MKKKLLKILFAAMPILLMALLWLEHPPVFATSDDTYIMKALSGTLTGEPYYETAFFSVLLGWPLSMLYRLVYLPWFGIFLISLTLLAQTKIFFKIYDMLFAQQGSRMAGGLLFVAALGMLAYHSRVITYTTVASLVGTASILYLFDYMQGQRKKQLACSAALLIVSVAIRSASGIIILAFWGLSYLYLLAKNRSDFKALFVRGGIIVLCFLAAYGFDLYMKHHVAEPEGYYEFMQAQADFVDYPKMPVGSEEVQAVLPQTGWDTDLYNMASGYFTMDERLDAEDYHIFNRLNKSLRADTKETIANLKETIYPTPLYHYSLTLIFILLVLYFSLMFLKGGVRSWFRIETALIALGAVLFAALHFWLAKSGRLVLRASLAISLPYFAILLGLFWKGELCSGWKKGKMTKAYPVLLAAGILAAFVLVYRMSLVPAAALLLLAALLSYQQSAKDSLYRVLSVLVLALLLFRTAEVYQHDFFGKGFQLYRGTRSGINSPLERYALAHQDQVFICDLVYSWDYRMHIPQEKVNNMFYYGGTNVRSHVFQEQMRQRNIEKFDLSILRREDMRVILRKGIADVFQRMLAAKGIHGSFVAVDQMEWGTVYQFVADKS